MPTRHFEIGPKNTRDDRLVGYSIDVETAPNFEPDIARLCDWAQNIALGVLDGGWTHNDLLDESVHIKIVTRDRIAIVDTIRHCKRTNAV